MDYGKLVSRAWDIVWKHKFLIILGVLVVLGSANGGGSAGQQGMSGMEQGWEMPQRPFFNFQAPLRGFGLPVMCCFLWPLLLLIQGTVAAFFSTLWTLAWKEWTG